MEQEMMADGTRAANETNEWDESALLLCCSAAGCCPPVAGKTCRTATGEWVRVIPARLSQNQAWKVNDVTSAHL